MIYRQLSQEEFADLQTRIIYEDNHLFIFNKRPGEIVQGDKTGDEPLSETLKAFIALRDSKPGQVFMGVPHRLDRPVSGIVVFAKTSKALERLAEMFRNGDFHKTYLALCCNKPGQPEGTLEDWIVRNEKQNKSYVAASVTPETAGAQPEDMPLPKKVAGRRAGVSTNIPSGAKLARLKYRWLQDTDNYHLLEVELLTGRHHQIRCQLAQIGCVIKGDLKYGAPRSNPDGGICLHSYRATFVHPVRKEELTLTAPVPSSWKGVNI